MRLCEGNRCKCYAKTCLSYLALQSMKEFIDSSSFDCDRKTHSTVIHIIPLTLQRSALQYRKPFNSFTQTRVPLESLKSGDIIRQLILCKVFSKEFSPSINILKDCEWIRSYKRVKWLEKWSVQCQRWIDGENLSKNWRTIEIYELRTNFEFVNFWKFSLKSSKWTCFHWANARESTSSKHFLRRTLKN